MSQQSACLTSTASNKQNRKKARKSKVPAERLRTSLNGLFNHDDFAEHARASASSNGCYFLFDFPAGLLDKSADKAAAILCPDRESHQLIFLTYQDNAKRIVVVEASEAPLKLVDFAWSFARVLTYLPQTSEATLN